MDKSVYLDTMGSFPELSIVKDHISVIGWSKGKRTYDYRPRGLSTSIPWYKILWYKYKGKAIPWEFNDSGTTWQHPKIEFRMITGHQYILETKSNVKAEKAYDFLKDQLEE